MTDPYYIEAMTESAERLCDCGQELEEWETECGWCDTKHCVCCGAKMDNNDSTQLCWQCQILIEEN